jgi:hypothetical protein
VTYRLFVPHRATLRVYAAVLSPGGPSAAAVRIGISDGRRYDHLREQVVTSEESAKAWVPLEADLSFYAGRKWSLFYRPDSIRWEIVVGTYVASGSPEGVVLGEPGLYADTGSAREYRERLLDSAGPL